jgi:small nuclear ribonucleoprotein (snRNP)-like protein
VPFPDVAPLDNISACRRLLPDSSEDVVRCAEHPRPPPKDAGSTSADAAPPPSHASGSGHRVERPPLSAQWRASFEDGPLSVLKALRRQRVRVVVRRQFGLRGVVEGQLEVFDRHWNLVLTQVVERWVQLEYTEAAEGGGAGASEAGGAGSRDRASAERADSAGSVAAAPPASSDTVGEWRQRSSPQVLVRGDCIVSVCALLAPAAEAGPAGRAASRPASRRRATAEAGQEAFRRLAEAAAQRGLAADGDGAAAGGGGHDQAHVGEHSVSESPWRAVERAEEGADADSGSDEDGRDGLAGLFSGDSDAEQGVESESS